MKRHNIVLLFILILAAACQNTSTTSPTVIPPVSQISLTITSTIDKQTITPSPTMDPLASATETVEPTPTEVDLTKSLDGKIYSFAPYIPGDLREDFPFPVEMTEAGDSAQTDFHLALESSLLPGQECLERYTWVYALVSPFPTVDDGVALEEIPMVWEGSGGATFGPRPIIMDAETAAVFSAAWGAPAASAVQITPSENLLEVAWAAQRSWAIVPFDYLEARWKVLRIAEMSPFDRRLDTDVYPLALSFCWSGNPESFALWQAWRSDLGFQTAFTNRDLEKMTVLNMTGVTALVRGTAAVMEEKGITYPAQDVAAWLREADITHISNEVAFSPDCPAGLPLQEGMSFCSRVEYFELLEAVGADLVELTGNHINDWGNQALLFTLDLYRQEGIQVFGGGKNLDSARQPLLVEEHGNRLAFIGCNSAGPQRAWATADLPGAAQCDREWLANVISAAREAGYLPIVTFQHLEVCDIPAHATQMTDFTFAARAGAVIISGSQAHCPQMFAFEGDTLIHYGLGNLFFDQMDFASRRGFIDRHIFYDGRYIGVEVATTMIEEAARPRFMMVVERRQLLREVFEASGW